MLRAVFFLIAVGLLNHQRVLSQEHLTAEQSDIIQAEMLRLINDLRGSKRIKPLELNHDLNVAAQIQSDYNAENNSYTHSQRNRKLNTVEKRIRSVSTMNFSVSGENVAYLMFDNGLDEASLKILAKDFFELWEDSPGHKKNMLSRYYNRIGFSVSFSGGTAYGSQVFTD